MNLHDYFVNLSADTGAQEFSLVLDNAIPSPRNPTLEYVSTPISIRAK